MDSYQAAAVNGGGQRVTARPRHSPCYGTAHRAEGKAVSVLDLSGLIRDRQRALPRCEDGECLFCLGEGIISAAFCGDLDLVVSGFRPVPGPVIDGVLCCRDHAVVIVLDRDRRFMLFAVIGSPAGVELNGEVGHSLRGDSHCSQRCTRRVVVVAVALHAVPDLVAARAGPSGEAGGIGPVVQRVFHRAFRGGTRRVYQRQGKAGVLQISGCRGRGHLCFIHIRLENRCGGGGGVGDEVVLIITRTASKVRIRAVNVHLLIRSSVGVLEAAGQSNANGIAVHQIAGVQRSGNGGSCTAVISLRRRRHNGCHRLFVRVERPGSGLIGVAGFGAGGCDRDRTHAGDGEQSVGNAGNCAVADRPGYCSVTACGPQLDGVAIVDPLPCAGDGQRLLVRREDFKCGGGGKIVVGTCTGNGQSVRTYTCQVSSTCRGVLTAVDHKPIIICDSDCGLLFLPVERRLFRCYLDSRRGHVVDDNGGSYRLRFAVIVVVVALGLVPDGIIVHILRGGNGRSIRTVLSQSVDHRAVGRAARLGQRLPGAVVGQVFQALRRRCNRRSTLRNLKGPRTVYDVVAAVGVGDDDRCRTGVDVVAVGQGVLGAGDERGAVLHLDTSSTRLLFASIVSIGAGHGNLRTDNFLRLDGHGNRANRCAVLVVAIADSLVGHRISSRVDRRGNVFTVSAAIQRVLDMSARCGASGHQLLLLSGVGEVFGLGVGGQLCAALADLKCYAAADGVVAALVIRDGDSGVAYVLIIAVAGRVLAGRNDHRTVLDNNRGLFLASVIRIVVGSVGVRLQVVAGQLDSDISIGQRQRFPADGHLN